MDPVSQPGTAQTRSKRWLWVAGIAPIVVALWVTTCVVFVVRLAGSFGLGGQEAGLVVTISEETTHIVRPLDDDGYVDYIAALSERSRQGITPDNNAALLLWQAVGQDEVCGIVDDRHYATVFRELGVGPLREDRTYFVSLYTYGKELDEAGPPPRRRQSDDQTPHEDSADPDNWTWLLDDQSDEASQRPWSPGEFPQLATWLERNKAPLGLMIEGSRKERFYSPRSRGNNPLSLLDTWQLAIEPCGDVCNALTIRAMLRLQQRNAEVARQDLLACHRWARLIGQGPFFVDALAAWRFDAIACSGDAAVARHGNLTSDEIRRYRADLKKLGPLPQIAERIDLSERFTSLDIMIVLAREGPGVLGSPDDEDPFGELLWQKGGNRAVDWDTVLRVANEHYNRVVEIVRVDDRVERARAIVEFEEEVDRQVEANAGLRSLAKSALAKGPRKALAEKIGLLLAPLVSGTLESEDRALAKLRMADTSLALAAYRADHGGYPEKLAELVPEYVDEVSRDVFTEDELRYALIDDDYLLYSVGPNGEDEEGRTHESEPRGDDVVIRTASVP
ncbi:MAG: hypothetical protein HQ582_30750 [Planctomycetes bacterium]|nr:hypothetical protein [Planctomycetota bacterium]